MAGPREHPGLRERKKQATRTKLIDAAAELVEKQGYAKTTVEQIANAVDVSPRTVAHYFPSKEQLLQAMLAANTALLDRMAHQDSPTGARRLVTLLRTLHVSPQLQPLSSRMRSPAMVKEMARRMGTDPADRAVELVFAVWSALAGSAWSGISDMYTAGEVDTVGLPAVLRQRLIDAVDELSELSG